MSLLKRTGTESANQLVERMAAGGRHSRDRTQMARSFGRCRREEHAPGKTLVTRLIAGVLK